MAIEINVVYPTTKEGWVRLQNRIDELHAKAIVSTIEKLDCSFEQKQALFEEVKAEIKVKAEQDKKAGVEAWKTNIHLAQVAE